MITFDFTTAGEGDCVAAVIGLAALHNSVNCMYLFFVIMDSIVEF